MVKTYDLLSKSDMRKFQKDLEKAVIHEAKSAVSKMEHKILCPHCGSEITVRAGKNICSHCHNEVEVTLDLD